jgi:hypothetical protein
VDLRNVTFAAWQWRTVPAQLKDCVVIHGPILEPATPFIPGTHHEAIAGCLKAAISKQLKRLADYSQLRQSHPIAWTV